MKIKNKKRIGELALFNSCLQHGSSATLELDLEHYVVPAPATSANSALVYAANLTETPRSLKGTGVFSRTDGANSGLHSYKDGRVSNDRPATIKVIHCFCSHIKETGNGELHFNETRHFG